MTLPICGGAEYRTEVTDPFSRDQLSPTDDDLPFKAFAGCFGLLINSIESCFPKNFSLLMKRASRSSEERKEFPTFYGFASHQNFDELFAIVCGRFFEKSQADYDNAGPPLHDVDDIQTNNF